ncbi:transposase [Candidatus Poriferisodalis sp.]|uniref:transposase n=1 Tax=Candidatus Poriferisodalis sp. TaxID=3101277 RepID=UPI003D0C3093
MRFAATDCSQCELKARCTTRDGGRIIEINPHEELLAPARAQRHEPEFLARYRLRSQAERKIAQIKSRTKNVPWRGLDKANLWLDLRIAALNLDRAGRLGIIRQNTRAHPRPEPTTRGDPTTTTGHTTAHAQHTPIADHPPR